MSPRRSPLVALPALVALTALACGTKDDKRKDDLTAIAADYERPEKDVFGDVHSATLVVTQNGMTFEDDPMRDSMLFDEVVCEPATSCKVTGLLCSATLEKREDGNVVVNTEARCEKMAGLWYSKDNAKKRAAELVGKDASPSPTESSPADVPSSNPSGAPSSTPRTTGSSSSLIVPPNPSSAAVAAASATAFSLAPTSRSASPSTSAVGIPCLQTCNQTTMGCARSCAAADIACGTRCNEAGFACAVRCTGF